MPYRCFFACQVLYVQAFVFVILLGKLMRKLFFGQLRPAEMEVSHVRILYPLLPCLGQPADIFILQIISVFFVQYSLQCNSFQHVIERSWYAVTETCLAFTVFRDDFSPRFVALFTLLLFLKCFHWLAEDRVDYVSLS